MDWWQVQVAVVADTWVWWVVVDDYENLSDIHTDHKSSIQYFSLEMMVVVVVVVLVHVEMVAAMAQTVDVCPAGIGDCIWQQVVGMVFLDHGGQLVDLQMESLDAEMHYLCQEEQVNKISVYQVSEIVIQPVDYVVLVTENFGETVNSPHVTVIDSYQHF